MNKIASGLLILALSTTTLAGCSQSSKQSTNASHVSTTKKAASATSASHKATTKKASTPVTFASNTLTTKTGVIKITGQRQVASAFPNYQQLLITYTYSNKAKSDQVPSDLWSKYIRATQGGKSLVSGSLSLTGGNSDADNDDINNSVTPVSANKQVSVAAMYKVSPTGGPVTLTIRDGHHTVGSTTLNINANTAN
ncbi:MAG TPA: hypothetical protein DCW31_02900 [Lactobacillus sp.]|nr:hypothetical protein [Lactobacillus sp.]